MGYASQYRCPANSIIIGRKGSINNPIFVEEPFWNVDTAFGVVPNITVVVPKFFYYFCRNYDFTKHDVSVTIPSLRRTDILKIGISVPSLPEQERIVAELDLLTGIIDKQKAQLKELDTLAQSIFYDMFGDPVENEKGWEKSKIGSFSKCVAGATPSTKVLEYWENGTIPWLSSGEVSQGRIFSTNAKITQLGYDNASTKLIPAHTVLIALAGQGKTRGTVGVAEIPLCTNQSICSIITNSSIDADFLYYQLKYLYNELRGISNGDGGRGGLNLKIIQNFAILTPPLAIQQAFAEKITVIESQKASINRSIAETQKLFDYAMDKYFG